MMPTTPTTFAMNPYTIQGDNTFRNTGTDYNSRYNDVLEFQNRQYANILGGYQGLNKSVLGNIQGAGQSALDDVTKQYAQERGNSINYNISHGLGNSTIQGEMQRGLGESQARANTYAKGEFAKMYAGQQSQLGQAQLGFMNSVTANYPNAQNYINPYAGLGGGRTSPPLRPPPAHGGGFVSGGYSGGMPHGGVPQTPSGNYGGGSYAAYVPPGGTGSRSQNLDFGNGQPGPYGEGYDPGFDPNDPYYSEGYGTMPGSSSYGYGPGSADPAYQQSYGGEYVYPGGGDYPNAIMD